MADEVGNEDDGNVEARYIQAGEEQVGAHLAHIFTLVPVVEQDEIAEVIQLMVDGKCCTCQNDLGMDSMIAVTHNGIAMAFCGGPCLSDMQVIGWLDEHRDDIYQRVQFRGGNT